jgi:cytochrome c553
MHALPRLSSLIVCALLAACGDGGKSAAPTTPDAASALPNPADVLAALPPEAQPYGRDAYTARCASCHGDLGQGVEKNPPLRGLSPAVMQQKLLDYRAGTVQGTKTTAMAQAAEKLSDAEIAAVSIYAGE